MSVVEGRDAPFAEPLSHRQDRCVDEAEGEIGVLRHQLAESLVVVRPEVLDREGTAGYVAEEARESRRWNKVVELHEHRRGYQSDSLMSSK